ncbi:MAG: biotin--[acetyl-CoA-carboxylase] ligase [Gammaproteobacteria bacterium]|nr:biotin--[acetyl-CoA-carboxylase] ligase [Gammaproteobacteria bacterium]
MSETNPQSLTGALPPALRRALGEIHHFDEIGSTNDEALRLLRGGNSGNRLLVAGSQTAGRGRRGHQWLSPPGAGLYFSLVRELPLPLERIQALGLVVALAVRAGLGDCAVRGVSVKWPNDLLSGKRKLGGILVENHGAEEESRHVVVGVGLNLRFPPEIMQSIDQPAVDIASICGGQIDWPALLPALLARLLDYIAVFANDGFAGFQREWNRHDRYFGEDVVAQAGAAKHIGRGAGVDAGGALLLRTADGVQRLVSGTIFPRAGAGPKP